MDDQVGHVVGGGLVPVVSAPDDEGGSIGAALALTVGHVVAAAKRSHRRSPEEDQPLVVLHRVPHESFPSLKRVTEASRDQKRSGDGSHRMV